MPAPQKVAILDVDGTLYPGSLGIDILKQLLLESIGHREHIDAIFRILRRYSEGVCSYDEMTRIAYPAYAAAIEGLSATVLQAVCERVWSRARDELFPFVLPLAELLRGRGFRVLIISGSPQEIVDALARYIGVQSAWGSTFESRNGIFTGRLGNCPGMVGRKVEILRDYMAGTPLDLAESVALGDSITDKDLFEMVGHPFMFEPNRELVAAFEQRRVSWQTVGKDDVLDVLDRSLGGGSPPRE